MHDWLHHDPSPFCSSYLNLLFEDNDSPPTSSTTNSTSPFTDEIPSDKKVVVEPHSHQPYCRLVIDNPFNDNNPMKVFGDDSVASLPIHKAVYNRYSSVTVSLLKIYILWNLWIQGVC